MRQMSVSDSACSAKKLEAALDRRRLSADSLHQAFGGTYAVDGLRLQMLVLIRYYAEPADPRKLSVHYQLLP